MISVEEAKAIIEAEVNPGKIMIESVTEAYGLTLYADVIARNDIPNFAQSSMDGYAIKFDDRQGQLSVIGEMPAGATIQLKILAGEATRIFTGAPLPESADTVVMQEKVAIDGKSLLIKDESIQRGQNVRLKGAEIKNGDTAMKAGTNLSTAALGFLSGIGCAHVAVFYPPRVAIVLTGNELQEPGRELQFGQVYEANSVQLSAALKNTGIREIKIYRAEDDPEKLAGVLDKAMQENDVVLLNGGVSVGDYDFVVGAAKKLGVDQKFHKIRQKPGKPLFFGTKGDKLIFGLPGNPSSSLTCFYEYVLPALEKMMQLPPKGKKIMATATHDYDKAVGLTHFLKGSYNDGTVTPLHAQESFRLHSFSQANCFIVLPEQSNGCKAGDAVEVHLLPA